MKARINTRRLHPDTRGLIRERMIGEIHLVLVEVYNWSPVGDRMRRLDDFAGTFLAKYDALYGHDTNAEITAVLNRVRAEGIDYDWRKGSGLKVMFAQEHDIVYLAYLLGLRKLFGFGKDRMQRFQKEINVRTQYYNNVFAGEYDEIMPVIENRLSRYGRVSKKA